MINHPGPLLMAFLSVSFLGFMYWTYRQYQKMRRNEHKTEWNDSITIALLVFAAFVLGIFLTYFAFYALPGG